MRQSCIRLFLDTLPASEGPEPDTNPLHVALPTAGLYPQPHHPIQHYAGGTPAPVKRGGGGGGGGGYFLSERKINALAYADDIAVSCKIEMQDCYGQVCGLWRQGRGFQFNARKCGSLYLINQAPLIYVDNLFSPCLGNDIIPDLSPIL